MPSDSIWDLQISDVVHSYHTQREQFTYDIETYTEWVWLVLEEGQFRFQLGKGRAALAGECHAGDWVLCPPHEPLRRRLLKTSSYHFARFTPLTPVTSFTPNNEVLRGLRGHGTLRDSQRLRADLSALRDVAYRQEAARWKAHLLRDVLLAAWWERENRVRTEAADAPIERTRLLLETRFASKLSMEAIAKQVHLTPPTFTRRFRALTGETPQEFLLQRRLDKARALLLETDLTLDAIAQQCGFNNGFYFSRLWTKRFGSSPARFRRAHRV